jgi:hypothetical protein
VRRRRQLWWASLQHKKTRKSDIPADYKKGIDSRDFELWIFFINPLPGYCFTPLNMFANAGAFAEIIAAQYAERG